MLEPKRTKYRKAHRNRGSLKGNAETGNRINFGSYGLKSVSRGEITSRQIESARRAITHFIKRGGKIWIRVFPHKPVTRKAAEVPMGSGKGALDHYVAAIKPGTIIFEMDGVPQETAKEAMLLAAYKLPLKCKFVSSKS